MGLSNSISNSIRAVIVNGAIGLVLSIIITSRSRKER